MPNLLFCRSLLSIYVKGVTKMNSTRTTRQKHLGRGLQSLLGPIISTQLDDARKSSLESAVPNFPPDKELQKSLLDIPVENILPNPYQPRHSCDDDELANLADSIRASGLLQPIIVRPKGEQYQLIAGHRRFEASKLAGLTAIPALVRQANDAELLELALIENIHRVDLNPIERAEAYFNYLNRFSLTQAEAAKKLGQDRSVIANFLRLLELPKVIKQMLVDGQLSMGHARALLALPTDELRRKLANRALAAHLSVRDVERLVRKWLARTGPAKTEKPDKAAHIIDLENKLAAELATKVSIEARRGGQQGRIIIDFYSLDDFDRITEKIGIGTAEQV